MILPENKRRDLNATKKKVVWLYGAPFSGKTYFANRFPDPLMLNTDGNIKFVDAPYIPIRDNVTVEGRLTKRKMAWEVFSEAVDELEKKQNSFKTIIVDLLEDVYEGCRVYICDRQGWKHESDDSFRAWDMVRGEFLNTLKRLVSLDYENIILISHEDRTRDLTRKSGDKISSIKPNIQDKVANKVAGMVDLVARVVSDDSDRTLSFKTSEVIFGGGRLSVRKQEIPLDYAAFCDVYDEAHERAAGAANNGGNTKTPATQENAATTTEQATESGSRRRSRRTATKPEAPVDPEPKKNVAEEDMYFYHSASDCYWMLKKGEEFPADIGESDPVSKEEYDKGIAEEFTPATNHDPEPEPPVDDGITDAPPDDPPEDDEPNDGTWEAGGGESVEQEHPRNLPKCPDAERIFKQNRESGGKIPLCSKIDGLSGCHRDGGPEGCPLLNKPGESGQGAETATRTRRTRRKREE